LPALSRAKERAYIAIDLNNIRQVLVAGNSFSLDNTDYLPFPGWDGLLQDCWAHQGGMPLATGLDSPSVISNQVEYAKLGQLAPYLGQGVKVFMCPRDLADSQRSKKDKFRERPVKITSFVWNGALTSYLPWNGPFSKFKLNEFRPTAILMWEGSEDSPLFNFNDTANTPHEGISQRHAIGHVAQDQTQNLGAVATMGNMSGSSFTIKMSKWFSPQMAGTAIFPAQANPDGPNDAWCNPDNPRGM
jgi:hypothetical protein